MQESIRLLEQLGSNPVVMWAGWPANGEAYEAVGMHDMQAFLQLHAGRGRDIDSCRGSVKMWAMIWAPNEDAAATGTGAELVDSSVEMEEGQDNFQ